MGREIIREGSKRGGGGSVREEGVVVVAVVDGGVANLRNFSPI